MVIGYSSTKLDIGQIRKIASRQLHHSIYYTLAYKFHEEAFKKKSLPMSKFKHSFIDFNCSLQNTHKRGSRHAAHTAKALRWRVD